jgi:hypothetical protein
MRRQSNEFLELAAIRVTQGAALNGAPQSDGLSGESSATRASPGNEWAPQVAVVASLLPLSGSRMLARFFDPHQRTGFALKSSTWAGFCPHRFARSPDLPRIVEGRSSLSVNSALITPPIAPATPINVAHIQGSTVPRARDSVYVTAFDGKATCEPAANPCRGGPG